MKRLIVIIFTLFVVQLTAQSAELTKIVVIPPSTETVKPKEERTKVAPTLWKNADGFEGLDSYCVFKSSVDKNLYLLGFDEEGNQIMKLLVEQANYNSKLNQVTVIYNGWEVRLWEQLF